MTAPIASGWSGCRVGLAPTGKRRLCTAHAMNGHRVPYSITSSAVASSVGGTLRRRTEENTSLQMRSDYHTEVLLNATRNAELVAILNTLDQQVKVVRNYFRSCRTHDREWHKNGPPSGPFSLFNSDLRSTDYVHHPNRGDDPDVAERR
jgi:hypothetical protein